MKVNKIYSIILLFAGLIFFIQIASAQRNDNLKLEIYSKLKCCFCNSAFDKCVCPEAKEMKAYIDALLENGVSKDEVLYKVAKKFTLNTILDKNTRLKVEQRLLKEAGKRHPRLILDSAYFNFGQVSKKQGKISKIFKLSNEGNSTLVIKNIKTSCPCTLVSLKTGKDKTPYFGTEGVPEGWKAEIKPQQSGELEVILDLASPHITTGKVVRDVTILNNDPLYPEVSIRVEAEVGD